MLKTRDKICQRHASHFVIWEVQLHSLQCPGKKQLGKPTAREYSHTASKALGVQPAMLRLRVSGEVSSMCLRYKTRSRSKVNRMIRENESKLLELRVSLHTMDLANSSQTCALHQILFKTWNPLPKRKSSSKLPSSARFTSRSLQTHLTQQKRNYVMRNTNLYAPLARLRCINNTLGRQETRCSTVNTIYAAVYVQNYFRDRTFHVHKSRNSSSALCRCVAHAGEEVLGGST